MKPIAVTLGVRGLVSDHHDHDLRDVVYAPCDPFANGLAVLGPGSNYEARYYTHRSGAPARIEGNNGNSIRGTWERPGRMYSQGKLDNMVPGHMRITNPSQW